MVSQSKSSINLAVSLSAIVMAASTTNAQLSTIPKRYRGGSNRNAPQEFGRRQKHQGRGRNQQRTNGNVRRKMENASSMPLESAEFDMSVSALAISPRMMSIPLLAQEYSNDFDMSMPLMDSAFDLSMSMPGKELPPAMEDDGGEFSPLQEGSDDAGSTIILASFLAGISAFVIGAAALFVKMRRIHGRQVDESREMDDLPMRVLSIPGDDLHDVEEPASEIVIT